MHWNPKPRQNRQIPICRVGGRRRPRHRHIVIAVCSLPTVLDANGEVAIGKPCENTAAHQALEIDHPVKLLPPHRANTAPDFPPMFRSRPTVTMKGENSRQVGIALQQRNESGVQPPKNFAGRPVEFQQPQHRQRLHDVAQGTRFENEDFQKAEVADVSPFLTFNDLTHVTGGRVKWVKKLNKLNPTCGGGLTFQTPADPPGVGVILLQ